jgi:hypothetical protein
MIHMLGFGGWENGMCRVVAEWLVLDIKRKVGNFLKHFFEIMLNLNFRKFVVTSELFENFKVDSLKKDGVGIRIPPRQSQQTADRIRTANSVSQLDSISC